RARDQRGAARPAAGPGRRAGGTAGPPRCAHPRDHPDAPGAGDGPGPLAPGGGAPLLPEGPPPAPLPARTGLNVTDPPVSQPSSALPQRPQTARIAVDADARDLVASADPQQQLERLPVDPQAPLRSP